jgi:hypothetical protein
MTVCYNGGMKKLLRYSIVVLSFWAAALAAMCVLPDVIANAYAQSGPVVSNPVTFAVILALLGKFTIVGSALSTFLAVVAGVFPNLTWLNTLAQILGKLPVLDVYGMTVGRKKGGS